jgi:hypothetical protein
VVWKGRKDVRRAEEDDEKEEEGGGAKRQGSQVGRLVRGVRRGGLVPDGKREESQVVHRKQPSLPLLHHNLPSLPLTNPIPFPPFALDRSFTGKTGLEHAKQAPKESSALKHDRHLYAVLSVLPEGEEERE